MELSFSSYFEAESYLEMHGFHCEKEQWINTEKQNATAVYKDGCVFIEFNETVH